MNRLELKGIQASIEHKLDGYLEMNIANDKGHIVEHDLLSVYLLFKILEALESIDASVISLDTIG